MSYLIPKGIISSHIENVPIGGLSLQVAPNLNNIYGSRVPLTFGSQFGTQFGSRLVNDLDNYTVKTPIGVPIATTFGGLSNNPNTIVTKPFIDSGILKQYNIDLNLPNTQKRELYNEKGVSIVLTGPRNDVDMAIGCLKTHLQNVNTPVSIPVSNPVSPQINIPSITSTTFVGLNPFNPNPMASLMPYRHKHHKHHHKYDRYDRYDRYNPINGLMPVSISSNAISDLQVNSLLPLNIKSLTGVPLNVNPYGGISGETGLSPLGKYIDIAIKTHKRVTFNNNGINIAITGVQPHIDAVIQCLNNNLITPPVSTPAVAAPAVAAPAVAAPAVAAPVPVPAPVP
jgi:hypothetical protein